MLPTLFSLFAAASVVAAPSAAPASAGASAGTPAIGAANGRKIAAVPEALAPLTAVGPTPLAPVSAGIALAALPVARPPEPSGGSLARAAVEVSEPSAAQAAPAAPSRQSGEAASTAAIGSTTPGAAAPTNPATGLAGMRWSKLDTEPYPGKQDDIFFVNPQVGFYGNGAGKIFKTTDGGKTWRLTLSQPGTYFRAIAFIDEEVGFAGNIGTDYFPNVTDTAPLYMTTDGGDNWRLVSDVTGPQVKGLCAIDVLKTRFIDGGVLKERTLVHAAGRVGGPTYLMRSLDGGRRWTTIDMSPWAAMILDVKFFDEMNGLIFAATDSSVERTHALILSTNDGGVTWKPVYQSARPFELVWKASFPTRDVGYATLLSYDPASGPRLVLKTVDGGKHWTEMPLTGDPNVHEFGVGFLDDKTGWVGTSEGGFETLDGGESWRRVDIGRFVNKIRILREGAAVVGYAIGADVYKLERNIRKPETK